MAEGFFERWSRRKQQARADEAAADPALRLDEAPSSDPGTPGTRAMPAAASPPEPTVPVPAAGGEAGDAPAPTLEDARALTLASDFRPFAARGVAPAVRNAAFKRLFADPHFNVMDGLDTYIDDYSQSTPIPDDVLRRMASARFLGLVDEQPPAASGADAAAPAGPEPPVAQSVPHEDPSSPPAAQAPPASQETDDHHADLRLQPDDAPGAEGPGRSTG